MKSAVALYTFNLSSIHAAIYPWSWNVASTKTGIVLHFDRELDTHILHIHAQRISGGAVKNQYNILQECLFGGLQQKCIFKSMGGLLFNKDVLLWEFRFRKEMQVVILSCSLHALELLFFISIYFFVFCFL